MVEVDDIQHILLNRAPALTGRYEFLSFRKLEGGRRWLAAVLERVHSAQSMRESLNVDRRWVTVAFTWNGLRTLGVSEAELATFPDEFKQGMVARAARRHRRKPSRQMGGQNQQPGPSRHRHLVFARCRK